MKLIQLLGVDGDPLALYSLPAEIGIGDASTMIPSLLDDVSETESPLEELEEVLKIYGIERVFVHETVTDVL